MDARTFLRIKKKLFLLREFGIKTEYEAVFSRMNNRVDLVSVKKRSPRKKLAISPRTSLDTQNTKSS